MRHGDAAISVSVWFVMHYLMWLVRPDAEKFICP